MADVVYGGRRTTLYFEPASGSL